MVDSVSWLQHLATLSSDPLINVINRAFLTVIDELSAVYVLIDALNECGSDALRFGLLSRLKELQATTDIRLLVTSRFDLEFEKTFRTTRRPEVRVTEQDVRRYVAGQMFWLRNCIQRDVSLGKRVENSIVKAVSGMYVQSYYTKALPRAYCLPGSFLLVYILIRSWIREIREASNQH
jgi:hypothetical protein